MLLWVTNSKACPIVIDFNFSQFAAYKKLDNILLTFLELAELASELKPLYSAHSIPLTIAVEPSVSIKFPNVSEEYFWTNEEILPGSLHRGSLQLRVATKPCISLGMRDYQSYGPYLVHLDLRDPENRIYLTMDEALDIMKVYKNLRSLAIRVGYPGDEHDNCTLSSLKTLAISWYNEVDPAPLLNSLYAPSLENLELDGKLPPIDFSSGNIWDSLINFLQRSAPPLRSLDLYKLQCEEIDLLGCLARCDVLERLWVEESSVLDRFVNELTEGRHPLTDAAQRTLENLNILALVRCAFSNPLQLFNSLVVSGHIWRITSLKGLYISDCNVHEGSIESWHLLRSRYEAGDYSVMRFHRNYL